ncbi:MAG: hypothetical protein CME65_01270 [Halobacteriovoraceae bacterium]|nr:hypothetical protein [Halobacteriovoraceae bacterium]
MLPFILLFISVSAAAEVLNYKNLNAVASLICQEVQNAMSAPGAESSDQLKIVSKFKQDKSITGESQFEIELSGTCNAALYLNQDKIELSSLGQEINLSFHSNKNKSKGSVGFYKVEVTYNKKNIERIELTNTLLGSTRIIEIESAQWSPNNMIFTTKPIKLKLKNGLEISEQNSILQVGSNLKVHNLWNFESFSCGSKLKREVCSKLINLI